MLDCRIVPCRLGSSLVDVTIVSTLYFRCVLAVEAFDSIVVGAGHNGLVCASYLAKQGRRVLVVEASETCGGLASSYEFFPGFKGSISSHASHFPTRIVKDLDLKGFGFQASNSAPDLVGLSRNADHVRLTDGHVQGVSSKDRDAFQDYLRRIGRFSDLLTPFWHKTVPPIGNNSFSEVMAFAELGLKIRLMGREDMQEFFRVVTLPMQDLMDEYFEHPLLKSILSWDALIGCKQAPRSPNNSVLQLLYRMAGESVACCDVEGLINSLVQAAVAKGVQIRTGARVDRFLIDSNEEGLSVKGLRLDSGEEIRVGTIVSSADPKTTFLKLLGAENLDIEFTNRVQRIRDRGMVSKLNLALSGLPRFRGIDEPTGRLLIAPDLDTVEWAYDDAKYGGVPTNPVLEMMIPSLHNAELAPHGQHVLSANIMYTPYQQRDGWSDEERGQLVRRTLSLLEDYVPGIGELILGHEVLTPLDLESRFNVSGGHWHHGDIAFDQYLMMRPIHGAAQYSTPVDGLYLCGSGSHPGGDLTGSAGFNAAREIVS